MYNHKSIGNIANVCALNLVDVAKKKTKRSYCMATKHYQCIFYTINPIYGIKMYIGSHSNAN